MSAILARFTGRIWFVYLDGPSGHRRLYFDRPDRTDGAFFSIRWPR